MGVGGEGSVWCACVEPHRGWSLFRDLIKVRRASPALTRGAYREVPTNHDCVFAFLREEGKDRILVAVNQ
jgi:glycosidase